MASYLALDIGDKRIGVAVADVSAPFPHPLATLDATQNLVQDFSSLLRQHAVKTVVIGMPRNQGGERTQQSKRVEYIASLLNIPKEVAVVWQDESLTSVKAEAELKKRKKPYSKGDVDALAATYILEDYLRSGITATATGHKDATQAAQSSNKGKKATSKRPFKRVLLAVALLIVAAVITVIGWYFYSLTPKSNTDQYSIVAIKSGTSTGQIAQELQSQGVIRSARAFVLYTRLNGVSGLQAGDYRLSSAHSVQEIVKTLSGGTVTNVNILIAPGLRLDQIVGKLQDAGYSQADIEGALVAIRDHPLLKDLPADTKLEGYLFPDTYQIGADTSAEAVMRLMLDNFQKKISIDATITSGIADQGITLNQAVIIASIVQQEVRTFEDQQKVAQVFLRRFKEGIPLGADPTFRYAAAIGEGTPDPSNQSRYNTRRFAGLPPTAISNFNISALTAVANPSKTNYLYFVAGDDGTTYFSFTLEEHEALTRRYCTTLCN